MLQGSERERERERRSQNTEHMNNFQKMPPVWKGRIAIKNTAEITVQMHYMFGQKEYGLNALSTLSRGLGANRDPTMRIGQRMKAEGESLYREYNMNSH